MNKKQNQIESLVKNSLSLMPEEKKSLLILFPVLQKESQDRIYKALKEEKIGRAKILNDADEKMIKRIADINQKEKQEKSKYVIQTNKQKEQNEKKNADKLLNTIES